MLFRLDVASARLPACDRDKAERSHAPVQPPPQAAPRHEADSSHTGCCGHTHEQTASRTRHAADPRKVLDRIDRRYRRPNLGCLRLYPPTQVKVNIIVTQSERQDDLPWSPRRRRLRLHHCRLLTPGWLRAISTSCVYVRVWGGSREEPMRMTVEAAIFEPSLLLRSRRVERECTSCVIARLPLSAFPRLSTWTTVSTWTTDSI